MSPHGLGLNFGFWIEIGRNLDLNKIRFSYLHYILQYSFWFGFESEKLESLYWYLEKTQGHSMRHTTMITICKFYTIPWKGVSVLCPAECWHLRESTNSDLHSTTRQAKQKIPANLDNHWSKKCSFLCVQTNWVCLSGTQRFCKNDSDSSHWFWLESSHSVKNVTRVESSQQFSQRDSSRVRVTKNRDSSRVIESSHAILTA